MADESAYKVLAGKHGYPDSPRYRRVLEYLMTPQQAKIAALLPSTSEEVSAKLGIDVATVNLELDRLFRKGVVFTRNLQTMEGSRFASRSTELQDATCMSSLGSDPSHLKELCELWEDFDHEEWHPDKAMLFAKLPQPMARIIPAYKSILDSPQILPYEDVREIIKAQPSIAVVACPCRQKKRAIGKTCSYYHDGACFHFGHSVDYITNRGLGTEVSLEKALQLIDEVEEGGLVHSWTNSSSMSRSTPAMCNCCVDCCVIFQPLIRFEVSPTKLFAKSRYEARVEQDICNGCQVCIERCQFDAIDMVKPEGSKKLKALVNAEKCMGCGVCVLGCEPKALSMKLVRPVEHIPQLPYDPVQMETPWF